MHCSKEYLNLTLKLIRTRTTLIQLVHEFGSEHPKVIKYNSKLEQLISELENKK